MKLIESDILFDRLDLSLNKYRSQSVLAAAMDNGSASEASKRPSLLELWEAFVEFKRPQCSPNTMLTMYATLTSYERWLPMYEHCKRQEYS